MVIFSHQLYNKIISIGNKSPKREICGVILRNINGDYTTDELFEIPNIAISDQRADFIMHPNILFKVLQKTTLLNKNANMVLFATFHSHPNGLPVPSVIDLENLNYEIVHFIYGMSLKDYPSVKPIRAWTYKKDKSWFDEQKIMLR